MSKPKCKYLRDVPRLNPNHAPLHLCILGIEYAWASYECECIDNPKFCLDFEELKE